MRVDHDRGAQLVWASDLGCPGQPPPEKKCTFSSANVQEVAAFQSSYRKEVIVFQ